MELAKRAISEKTGTLQLLQEKYQASVESDTLALNQVRKILFENCCEWDREFASFVRTFLVSEKLEKRPGGPGQLKRLFADRDLGMAAYWNLAGKRASAIGSSSIRQNVDLSVYMEQLNEELPALLVSVCGLETWIDERDDDLESMTFPILGDEDDELESQTALQLDALAGEESDPIKTLEQDIHVAEIESIHPITRRSRAISCPYHAISSPAMVPKQNEQAQRRRAQSVTSRYSLTFRDMEPEISGLPLIEFDEHFAVADNVEIAPVQHTCLQDNLVEPTSRLSPNYPDLIDIVNVMPTETNDTEYCLHCGMCFEHRPNVDIPFESKTFDALLALLPSELQRVETNIQDDERSDQLSIATKRDAESNSDMPMISLGNANTSSETPEPVTEVERLSIMKTLKDFWMPAPGTNQMSSLLGGSYSLIVEFSGLKPLNYPL
jgi:hypothetical protein